MQTTVTAIDVMLEPDATMLKARGSRERPPAQRLPKRFQSGCEPPAACHDGAAFRPHGRSRQGVCAAGKVFAGANVTGLKLESFKYYYIPDKDIGLSGIVVKPTPELLKLQQDVIAAVAPFTEATGTSAAFVTTPDDPVINPLLIEYVAAFVPKASGEHFNPHVTTGVASREYLDKMLAEPFEPFTFSPAGAAAYQLGQFGTAAKKLKEWI
jgi:hypothetical protein